MKKSVLLLALIVSTSTHYLKSQVKGTSNAFILPNKQSVARPVELTIDLTFKGISGSLVLIPNGTGQLLVGVTNTGGIRAKDVRLKLIPASTIDDVSFDRVAAVGDIDPSQRKEVAVLFTAGKALTDQKRVINIEAAEAATTKIFTGSFAIETSSGVQRLALQNPLDSKRGLILQPTPSEKLSPAVLQLRDKVAANPNDGPARLHLIQLLYDQQLYNDVILEGEKALAIFQDKPILYQEVGESYRRYRRYDEALQLLERGYNLTKEPSSELAASYASTLLHVDKMQDATLVFHKAAQADPSFVMKRLSNANSELNRNDVEFAATDYFAVLIVKRSQLTPEQISLVQFSIDFKGIFESNDRSAASASFLDNVKKKLGGKLDYDGLGAVFARFVTTNQLIQASNFYAEILKWNEDTINQDTLDKKFLGIAYGYSDAGTDVLPEMQNAFARRIKNAYSLDDEEVKPICALHTFVLKEGSVSAASDITTGLLNGVSLPQYRYVQLANMFVRYRKNDDAVGTFGLVLKKKGLEKFVYKNDLVEIYSGLLQTQKTADAQQLMKEISDLNENDTSATYSALADVFAGAGQSERSLDVLRLLVRMSPTSTGASVKLGEALLANKRYDDLLSTFADVPTKEGKRYAALAYEKKQMLKEANQVWEEFRKLSRDPKELADAKKHEDDNLIALFNPKSQAQQSSTTTLNEGASADQFNIMIDSPSDGSPASSSSITMTGRFVGAVSLQDIRVNGKSVGTDRGMKMVDAETATTDASGGLPFSYVVSLTPGKNVITIDATSASGQLASARVTVSLGAEAPKAFMSIEEADGIRQSKAYAVIIGVANYVDPSIPSLNYTVNDARALYDVLTDPQYGGFKKEHVTLLLNQDATTSAIKKAIGVDLKRAPEDGIAVVFFAGHGAPEGEQTYWLTYDTKISQTLYASALSNDDISDMLHRINTKRVVTLLDCCYSGASITASRGTRAVLVDDPFKAFEGSGSIMITSSDGKEQSLEDPKLKHGIFTYRLLEALRGKADYNGDGIVMADEVARYVRETVPGDARERSHRQDPVVVANYTGYIPISRNPENVLKNSIILQVQRFRSLYLDGKIDAATFKKLKDILEGGDDKSKKPVKAYFDGVFTLKDLLEIVGK